MTGGRSRSSAAVTVASAAVALPIALGSVGVGIDQHRRPVATVDGAVEVRREGDDEHHIALRQRPLGIGFARQHVDVVVAAVAQRAMMVRSYFECSTDSKPVAGAADWC